MAQDNKVVSFQDRKQAGQFSLPPALIRLRDASGRELKSVLNEFFDRSDDAREAAESALSVLGAGTDDPALRQRADAVLSSLR